MDGERIRCEDQLVILRDNRSPERLPLSPCGERRRRGATLITLRFPDTLKRGLKEAQT